MSTEEQREELEVLRSIYGDRFIELCQQPVRIKITDINGDGVGFELEVEFTANYPHELPKYYINLVSGRLSNMDALRVHLNQEAEKSLGMAMTFNLISAMEDWLQAQLELKSPATSKSSTKNEASSLRHEEAGLTLKGGPVTAASFAEWLKKFTAEQAAAKGGEKKLDAQQKFTGRQLFERNKALATSDITFDDDGLVFADEEIYDGLDDLQLDEDVFDEINSGANADEINSDANADEIDRVSILDSQ